MMNWLRIGRRPAFFQVRVPEPHVATAAAGIAVVATILNEGDYIGEWIEFHRLVGIDHFLIYDNGSTDRGPAILADYVKRGLVTIVPWRTFGEGLDTQSSAYAHAVANFGERYRWYVLIDADEFLFPVNADSVPAVLAIHDEHASVRVTRFEYGPGGNKARPAGLVTESYLHAASSLKFTKVKSIVKPSAVTDPRVHRTRVDGTVKLIERPDQSSDAPSLRINHYFSKSEEEFEAKQRRGWRRRSDDAKIANKLAHFREVTTDPVFDDSIRRFSSRLPRDIG